jgi:hypothetical protein
MEKFSCDFHVFSFLRSDKASRSKPKDKTQLGLGSPRLTRVPKDRLQNLWLRPTNDSFEAVSEILANFRDRPRRSRIAGPASKCGRCQIHQRFPRLGSNASFELFPQ